MHKLKKLGTAFILGGFVCAASAGEAYSDEQIKTLQTRANQLLGPIPEKMPGAEKDSPAKVELGQRLYNETRLSLNNTMSCNTCHRVDQGLGGVDNLSTSPGAVQGRGDRNSPTVLNAGFQLAQFWDGREPDLQAQAKGPILNPIEMAMPSADAVMDRVRADAAYRELFKEAFPDTSPKLTYENLAEAIAAFERTLVTRDRFDDFQKGDAEALSQQELRGLDKFLNMGCTSCHNGALLGGNLYQKAGLVNAYPNFSDLGREKVTQNEVDKFFFKVPTLRNIEITSPYFHDGGIATLEAAVRQMAWLQLGQKISTEDTHDIVAFLKTLTDKDRRPKSD